MLKDPDCREIAEVSSYLELCDAKEQLDMSSEWEGAIAALKDGIGEEPTDKKKKAAFNQEHDEALKKIQLMELHESPEKLEESIRESLFTAAKKVKPVFTKKYREAATLKKKALQIQKNGSMIKMVISPTLKWFSWIYVFTYSNYQNGKDTH